MHGFYLFHPYFIPKQMHMGFFSSESQLSISHITVAELFVKTDTDFSRAKCFVQDPMCSSCCLSDIDMNLSSVSKIILNVFQMTSDCLNLIIVLVKDVQLGLQQGVQYRA